MSEPDVPRIESPAIACKGGIMVDRELPLSGWVPLHLERPPTLVVVALRHLTAQLDDLPSFDHMSYDATGDAELIEFSGQASRLLL